MSICCVSEDDAEFFPLSEGWMSCIFIYMYACIHIDVCSYIRTYVYIFILLHEVHTIYTHAHTYSHARRRTHIHIHMKLFSYFLIY